MRERIFEAFFQIKGAHPTQPGSGIGLTLASSLVQLHNGQLYLDEEAEDTSFVVEIPTNASADAQQAEEDVLIEDAIADGEKVSLWCLKILFLLRKPYWWLRIMKNSNLSCLFS